MAKGVAVILFPEGPIALDADAVVWREVGDEIVVLEIATAVYLTLNGTARPLWLLLADGATRDDLAAALVAEYGIAFDRAAADVDDFLAALATRSLLRPSEAKAVLGAPG